MKSLKTSTSFVLATAVFLWVAEIVLAVHEPFTSNIYQLLYIMEAEGQSSNIGGCRGAGLRRNNPEKSNLEKSEASLDKDNVHLDIVVLPEIDATIVGTGEGGRSGYASERNGAGFNYCKLGTGTDGDWNITGERYVFGPGLGIYFGAHYTNLYTDRWCGYGWYRPDDSVYFEDIYGYHIPDPNDYGYDQWNWYNVEYHYDPMSHDMRSLEDNWTAKWWDEGVSACNKIYTVMYDLFDHALCQDVQTTSPYDPINIMYNFDPSDEKCCSWIHLENYALNFSGDVKWMWYKPDGTLYSENEQDIPDPGVDSWHDWYKVWSWINIAGYYPASYPGDWRVDVYVNDYQGNYEYKFTEYFTIVLNGDPDIRIGPLSLALTCSEDVGGHNDQHNPMVIRTLLEDEPQQSTSGPVPPPEILPKSSMETQEREGGGAASTLSVPAYAWRHGCGPTALGMVLGYYDGLGYQDLIPGDADTQTPDVSQAIASQGNGQDPKHYEDYSLPDDIGQPSVLPDKSEAPEGDEHAHDCIADFMKTSWSSEGNYYGWSWSDDIGPAFTSYADLRDPNYGTGYQEYRMSNGTLTWQILTTEIDAGRPMVFLVDTDGNNSTDHFIAVVGYRDVPNQQYGCMDTWEPADVVRWCDFEQMASSQPWGIWGGWSFSLTPLSARPFTIYNDGNSALTVSSIEPNTPASWLDWTPKPPFTMQPGENVVITVTVDCSLAPCTDTTTRLLVYSDDPDENPYPGGINVFVTKPELTGDLSRDCIVEKDDLMLFVQDWLYQGCDTDADLYIDCRVDLKDFVVFSEYWLITTE